jgi:hypothetical protein
VTPIHVSNLCQQFSGEPPIHQRFRADNRSSCLCRTFSSAIHRTPLSGPRRFRNTHPVHTGDFFIRADR